MKLKNYLTIIVAFVMIFATTSANARDFEFSQKKLKFVNAAPPMGGLLKGPISGGFFLLLGVGTPSYKYLESNDNPYYNGVTNSMGLQYNLELGNQFLFLKIPDKFGLGISASWFNFGYCNYFREYYDSYSTLTNTSNVNSGMNNYTFYDFDFRFLKFGPTAAFAIKKIALDVSAGVVPLTFVAGGSSYNVYTQYGIFSNYTVSLKGRFKILTAGVDVMFGTNHYADDVYDGTKTISRFDPRFVVGFRF